MQVVLSIKQPSSNTARSTTRVLYPVFRKRVAYSVERSLRRHACRACKARSFRILECGRRWAIMHCFLTALCWLYTGRLSLVLLRAQATTCFWPPFDLQSSDLCPIGEQAPHLGRSRGVLRKSAVGSSGRLQRTHLGSKFFWVLCAFLGGFS